MQIVWMRALRHDQRHVNCLPACGITPKPRIRMREVSFQTSIQLTVAQSE
jgi:hypothetical protein